MNSPPLSIGRCCANARFTVSLAPTMWTSWSSRTLPEEQELVDGLLGEGLQLERTRGQVGRRRRAAPGRGRLRRWSTRLGGIVPTSVSRYSPSRCSWCESSSDLADTSRTRTRTSLSSGQPHGQLLVVEVGVRLVVDPDVRQLHPPGRQQVGRDPQDAVGERVALGLKCRSSGCSRISRFVYTAAR